MSMFPSDIDAMYVGDWGKVVSSHIDAAAWIEEDQRLYIRYQDGTIYSYKCDQETAIAFANADSQGRFRNQHWPGRSYMSGPS